MDDRRALANDVPIGKRDDQMMAGVGEVSGKAVGADGLVEHGRDVVEEGGVGWADAADFMGSGVGEGRGDGNECTVAVIRVTVIRNRT